MSSGIVGCRVCLCGEFFCHNFGLYFAMKIIQQWSGYARRAATRPCGTSAGRWELASPGCTRDSRAPTWNSSTKNQRRWPPISSLRPSYAVPPAAGGGYPSFDRVRKDAPNESFPVDRDRKDATTCDDKDWESNVVEPPTEVEANHKGGKQKKNRKK